MSLECAYQIPLIDAREAFLQETYQNTLAQPELKPNIMDRVLSTPLGKALTGLAVTAGFAANGAPLAFASSPRAESSTATITSSSQTDTLSAQGYDSRSVTATAKINWVSYVSAKGLSQKMIAKDKKSGRCESFGIGSPRLWYWNTGRSINGGMVTFKDNTSIYACKDAQGNYREIMKDGEPHNCDNLIEGISHMPAFKEIFGQVEQVKNIAKKFIDLTANASATASASCTLEVAGGSVSATSEGVGHGYANDKFSLSQVVKSHGSVLIKEAASVNDKASASAEASASVKCEESLNSTGSGGSGSQSLQLTMENQPSEGGFVDQTQPQQVCVEWTLTPQTGTPNIVFTDSNNNQLSAEFADPNGDPNSVCVDETAPTSPQTNDVVTASGTYDSTITNTVLTSSSSTAPFSWRSSTGF